MTTLPNLADPNEIARGVLADIYAPRERLAVDAWCEANVRIVDKGTGAARPGPWDMSHTPYFRQVCRDLGDPKVLEVTFKKSSQIGYSQLLIGYILYVAGELRQPASLTYPVEGSAIRFNERRLVPTLEECPATRLLIDRDRDIKQTEIRVGGVPIWFNWAQSKRTTKQDPTPIVIADEIDEWPPGGAILQNLRDRQRTYERCKLLKGSTPEDGETEGYITKEYDSAQHRYRYVVPCPITGEFFELYDFGLLKWHGGRTADPDTAGRGCWLQSPHVNVPAHLVGVTTDGVVHERHKRWMVSNGLWVRQGEQVRTTDEWTERVQAGGDQGLPELSRIDGDFLREPARAGRYSRVLAAREPDEVTRRAMGLVSIVGGEDGVAGRIPSASHTAYRANSLASLIDARGWGGIVSSGLKQGFAEEWQKGTLGQSPEVKGDIADVRHLRKRMVAVDEGGYAIGTIPEGRIWVATTVDVQKVCIYATSIAYGDPGTDPAVVGAVRIEREERRQLRDVEDALAAMRFSVGNGLSVPAVAMGIDSGHWTGDVYDLVERLKRRGTKAVAMKGEAGPGNRTLYRMSTVKEKDEYGNETGVTHDVLLHHSQRWQTIMYSMLIDAPGVEEAAAAETVAEPRSLAMPEPWAFDDGRTSGDSEDYIKQITAEKRIDKTVQGRNVLTWVPRREGINNHYGDCVRMNLALAQFAGVEMLTPERVESLRALAEKRPAKNKETPARIERPRRAPSHSPGTIVSRLYGGR